MREAFVFSQAGERPARYLLPARLDTIPSNPSFSAAAKIVGPSPAIASVTWMAAVGAGAPISSASLCLRSSIGQAGRIHPVEVQEVEGEEDQPVRLGVDGVLQRGEIGAAGRILDECLAIDQRGAAEKRRGRLDDSGVAVAPVMGAAGEGAGLPAADGEQCAKTVVLDLVQKAFAGRARPRRGRAAKAA